MPIHTTCASCGAALDVADHRQKVCAGCPPSPHPGDALARLFLAAAHDGDPAAGTLAGQLDAHEHRPPNLLGAALTYIGWGWPVFPVVAGHKRPATRHGVHDASTDEAQIRAWWARWPTANIGLPTGHRFDAIDVDPAGLAWWMQVRQVTNGFAEIHGQVSTPRGGYHLYVPATGGGNLANLAPGVDFRGRGGYVLAPPSVLVPAAITHGPVPTWPLRYTWLVRPSPHLTGATP